MIIMKIKEKKEKKKKKRKVGNCLFIFFFIMLWEVGWSFVRALNTLTYGFSYIMRYIVLVIFSINCTRLRLVQLIEKMTRTIYLIMYSRPYVNAYILYLYSSIHRLDIQVCMYNYVFHWSCYSQHLRDSYDHSLLLYIHYDLQRKITVIIISQNLQGKECKEK